MKLRLNLISFVVLGIALVMSSPAFAQDYDAMAKWTDAKVIRFHASGDYSGGFGVSGWTTKMTDHVEFDFDWDNAEMKVIGKPVIKNFPTKVGALVMTSKDHPLWGTCPEPKVETAPEHWTLQSVSNVSAMLQLQARQDSMAGSYPDPPQGSMGKCGETWTKAAVTSTTMEMQFQLPAAMMLEMGMAGTGFEVSKDKKSFVIKPTDQPGWVFTLTPTIVK